MESMKLKWTQFRRGAKQPPVDDPIDDPFASIEEDLTNLYRRKREKEEASRLAAEPEPRQEDPPRLSQRGTWGPTQYKGEDGNFDPEKSRLLAEYAQYDPSMGQQIAKFTNDIIGQGMGAGRAFSPNNRKDLYSMGQDMYLQKMNGLRRAKQSIRR